MTLRHLDLFSGIGGFALAASWVKSDTGDPLFETVGFVEIDKYCQKVLKKHWPDVPIYEDIRSLDGRQFKTVDIITGGFPCQPYSVAGKQAGKEDDRHLWPEYLRIIQEARPRWVIGENVSGIINMELDTVLSDLEREGYSTQTLIIPAAAVNARHRRDRVWVIAHSNVHGFDGREASLGREHRQGADGTSSGQDAMEYDTGLCLSRRQTDVAYTKSGRSGRVRNEVAEEGTRRGDELSGKRRGIRRKKDVAHPVSNAEGCSHGSDFGERERGREVTDIGERNNMGSDIADCGEDVAYPTGGESGKQTEPERRENSGGRSEEGGDVADSEGIGLQGERSSREQEPEAHGRQAVPVCDGGDRGMRGVEPRLGGTPDGVSSWVDGCEWWPAGWEMNTPRVAVGVKNRSLRLKGLGNAIVPQVAYVLLKFVGDIEKK